MLDVMVWVLKSGSHWCDTLEPYGPWKCVYDRFLRWSADSTIDKIMGRLRCKLDAGASSTELSGASTPSGASGTSKSERTNEAMDRALARSCGRWGTKSTT